MRSPPSTPGRSRRCWTTAGSRSSPPSPRTAEDDHVYNVNADTAAAALAAALSAETLMVLTDVEGLYEDWPNSDDVISRLTATELEKLLPDLSSGMVPKMQGCLHAVRNGVEHRPRHRRPGPALDPAGDLHRRGHRHDGRARRGTRRTARRTRGSHDRQRGVRAALAGRADGQLRHPAAAPGARRGRHGSGTPRATSTSTSSAVSRSTRSATPTPRSSRPSPRRSPPSATSPTSTPPSRPSRSPSGCSQLFGRPGRVFFSNSGAEANEAAFKIGRLTGRTHMVATDGGFHGRTMGASR